MRQLLFALTLLLANAVCAQGNYLYHGDKRYEATDTWGFTCNGYNWSDPTLDVSIAKKGTSGLLMLAIRVPTTWHHLLGTVLIYLADGSLIKCADKGVKDHVDEKAMCLYSLTAEEIITLMKTDIQTIRFSISSGGYGAPSDNYTAENAGERFPFQN